MTRLLPARHRAVRHRDRPPVRRPHRRPDVLPHLARRRHTRSPSPHPDLNRHRQRPRLRHKWAEAVRPPLPVEDRNRSTATPVATAVASPLRPPPRSTADPRMFPRAVVRELRPPQVRQLLRAAFSPCSGSVGIPRPATRPAADPPTPPPPPPSPSPPRSTPPGRPPAGPGTSRSTAAPPPTTCAVFLEFDSVHRNEDTSPAHVAAVAGASRASGGETRGDTSRLAPLPTRGRHAGLALRPLPRSAPRQSLPTGDNRAGSASEYTAGPRPPR